MNRIVVHYSKSLYLFKKLVNVFDGKLEQMFNDNWQINKNTCAVFDTDLGTDILRNIELAHNGMGTCGVIDIEVVLTTMEVSS